MDLSFLIQLAVWQLCLMVRLLNNSSISIPTKLSKYIFLEQLKDMNFVWTNPTVSMISPILLISTQPPSLVRHTLHRSKYGESCWQRYKYNSFKFNVVYMVIIGFTHFIIIMDYNNIKETSWMVFSFNAFPWKLW